MAHLPDILALGIAAVVLGAFVRSALKRTRTVQSRLQELQLRALDAPVRALDETGLAAQQHNIVRFLRGEGVDDRGRTLQGILSLSDAELELTHDFIQWLFPSPEASSCHASAPVATPQTFEAIRKDPLATDGLLRAFARMLQFYGLRLRAGEPAELELNTTHRDVSGWRKYPTHNDLRISRMLRAMSLCGQQAKADQLLAFLEQHFASNPDPQRQVSLDYWRQAARAGSSLP